MSDLAIRDAPLSPTTLSEIKRLTQPGARITYSTAIDGFESQAAILTRQFPNAKIIYQGKVGSGAGERGVIIIELP